MMRLCVSIQASQVKFIRTIVVKMAKQQEQNNIKLLGATALRHVSVAVKYRNHSDDSVACELRNHQLLTVL